MTLSRRIIARLGAPRLAFGLSGFVAGLVIGALALEPAPAEARPRRGAPRPVDHYTFSPERLAERVAPHRERYDHVILLNELRTEVTEGRGLCRLEWVGHRIDHLNEARDEWAMVVPLPRGAEVGDVSVHLIKADGRDGRKVEDPTVTVEGDSLMTVVVDELDGERVLELRYRLDGTGVSVDETFLFQPDVPVITAEYRFSVSRDLWQDAADAGLIWEFIANTSPSTWGPERTDTPEFYNWYWRDSNILPVDTQKIRRDPRQVGVTGYLPSPALAGIDPDDLPAIERFDAIRSLEGLLRNNLSDGFDGNNASSADVSGAQGTRDTLTPTRGK